MKGEVVQTLAEPVLTQYVPSGVAKGGDPKQLQTMVERSTGYTISQQTAQRTVQAAKGDTVTESLQQFSILGWYLQRLKEQDPEGTYDFEFERISTKFQK